MAIKMRHCWYCGAEMGEIDDRHYDRMDTCGKRECDRAARDELEEAREEQRRHERDLGYGGW